MNFNELEINDKIKKALVDIGFTSMMPIQETTIPAILAGDNIIGEAETGTGKTASFVIPLLNNIDFTSNQTECLIVTPTRELAIQIVKEIEKIGKYLNPTYTTIVGGLSIRDQVKELKKNPAIIVGTLGRINDHIRSKKINLSNVKYFVLDEADEMLKEGFKEDIDTINNLIPENKQTLLFSATISKQIISLSKSIMQHHKFISVKSDQQSTNIEQFYIVMKEKNKFATLAKLLDIDKPTSAIIFGRTKRRVDELNEALNQCGYKAAGIHGDLSQQQRNAVMKKFRESKIHILVATDVAARGIDISDVTHVYNFDLPQEVEFYVHRIGRTGRANKSGVSYSFIKEQELAHIHKIKEEAKVDIKEKAIPSSYEVNQQQNIQIAKMIDKKLSDIDITQNQEFINELISEYGAEKLAAVLVNQMSKNKNVKQVTLTGEPPVKVKAKPNRGNRNDRGNRSGGRGRSRDNSRGGNRNSGRDNNRGSRRNNDRDGGKNFSNSRREGKRR